MSAVDQGRSARTAGASRPVPLAARDDLARRVLAHLADHLRDTIAHAPAYAQSYADAVLTNRAGRPRPKGLHPEIAKLVRELTLDEVAANRRS